MYCPPDSGNIDPSSAKAAHPKSEMTPPITHTSKNSMGCGSGPAISFAVRKIEEPMIPLTSKRTESSRLSPRTSVGWTGAPEVFSAGVATAAGIEFIYPIPSSSEDSSAVPQRRQITDEQSPQVRGSFTSSAQFGQ
jgi:hypothetical protein